jgi:hypothetical protein
MSRSSRKSPSPAPTQAPASDSPFKRAVIGTFGVCLLLVSIYLVVMASYELAIGPSETRPGVLAGIIVFFLGTGVVAAILIKRAFLRRSAPTTPPVDPPESRILNLAMTRRGRVTVPEVAATCGLSLEESKVQLDRLALKGAADLQATDDGVLVYVFSGFLSTTEKERAEDF